MKEIRLTQGQVALVDDEDFDWLNKWKWYANKRGNSYYAQRGIYNNEKHNTDTVQMHRIILNLLKGQEIDHIDHNGLNNQKSNLRICNHQQNSMNQRNHKTKYRSSKYIGVYMVKSKYKDRVYIYWSTQITINGKNIYLGIYKDEEKAARIHDHAAKLQYGEFANLNFK